MDEVKDEELLALIKYHQEEFDYHMEEYSKVIDDVVKLNFQKITVFYCRKALDASYNSLASVIPLLEKVKDNTLKYDLGSEFKPRILKMLGSDKDDIDIRESKYKDIDDFLKSIINFVEKELDGFGDKLHEHFSVMYAIKTNAIYGEYIKGEVPNIDYTMEKIKEYTDVYTEDLESYYEE